MLTDLCTAIIQAAEAHGADSDPDMEVGDLQVAFREAWDALPEHERRRVFRKLWGDAADWHPHAEGIEKALAKQPKLKLHEGLPYCTCDKAREEPLVPLSTAWEDCGRTWIPEPSTAERTVRLGYTGETDDGNSDSVYLFCNLCGTAHYLIDYPDITIEWE